MKQYLQALHAHRVRDEGGRGYRLYRKGLRVALSTTKTRAFLKLTNTGLSAVVEIAWSAMYLHHWERVVILAIKFQQSDLVEIQV